MRVASIVTAVFLVAVGAAVVVIAIEAPPPIKITIEGCMGPQPELFLVGVPVPYRVTMENLTNKEIRLIGDPLRLGTTRHASGPISDRCKVTIDVYYEAILKPGIMKSGIIKPNERIEIEEDTRHLGIVEPGEYEIWIEYNAGFQRGRYLREGVPPLHVESNRYRFELIQPTLGIDRKVFKRMSNFCNDVVSGDTRYERQEQILSEFPASSYAGWILAVRHLAFLVDDPLARYLTLAERYIEARPDFAALDHIKLRAAKLKLRFGDLSGAKAYADELLGKNDLPYWLRPELKKLESNLQEEESRSKDAR